MLTVRALNPATEHHLFHVAYHWQPKHRRHTQPDRMTFEQFSATDSTQLVLGVFADGELVAVYLAIDVGKATVELHYTCQRGTPREWLVACGSTVVNWLLQNGWREVGVWLIPRNRAYVAMAQDCGLQRNGSKEVKGLTYDYYATVAQ